MDPSGIALSSDHMVHQNHHIGFLRRDRDCKLESAVEMYSPSLFEFIHPHQFQVSFFTGLFCIVKTCNTVTHKVSAYAYRFGLWWINTEPQFQLRNFSLCIQSFTTYFKHSLHKPKMGQYKVFSHTNQRHQCQLQLQWKHSDYTENVWIQITYVTLGVTENNSMPTCDFFFPTPVKKTTTTQKWYHV